jgi:dipeptide/tripeptide permease
MLVVGLLAAGTAMVTIGSVTLAPERSNVRFTTVVPLALIAVGAGLLLVSLIELVSA